MAHVVCASNFSALLYARFNDMKTLQSLITEAVTKWDMWLEIADDPQALIDREKTRNEALMLANFFEGRFNALCDAKNLTERI